MAKEVELSTSEARILVYLNQVGKPFKYAKVMALKLDMNYSYVSGLLAKLEMRGWLRLEHIGGVKRFWCTTKRAPIKEARTVLMGK